MTESVVVSIDKASAFATITLNRPDRLNAFTVEMHAALAAALDQVEQFTPALRSLLVTGAGRGFCAGQDLSDRSVSADTSAPDLGESLEQRYNPLVRRCLLYTSDAADE